MKPTRAPRHHTITVSQLATADIWPGDTVAMVSPVNGDTTVSGVMLPSGKLYWSQYTYIQPQGEPGLTAVLTRKVA